MAEKKIPTIVFGPGDERFAHSANEKIEAEQLLRASMFYAALPKILAERLR